MIGGFRERRAHWWQAAGISVVVHGAAAAAMLDVIPAWPRPDANSPLPQIEVTTIPLDTGGPDQDSTTIAALTPVDPLTSRPGQTPPAQTQAGDEAAAVPAETADPRPPNRPDRPDAPETVLPGGDGATIAVPLAPDGVVPPVGRDGETLAALRPPDAAADPAAGGAGGSAARDGVLVDLVGAIRERLAEPCLIAMPQTLGTDQVQLTVLGADDRAVSGLFGDVASQVEVPMTERSVLLDSRQCPALDFARAAPTYPALPLGLQIESADLTSGDRLRGRVTGAGPDPVSLLLIDDNGVVQDLRRFSLQAGEALDFDVPVRRFDAPRDTSQLLIALATPARPETLAQLAGRQAQDVFPALRSEIGANARIGVIPFFLR